MYRAQRRMVRCSRHPTLMPRIRPIPCGPGFGCSKPDFLRLSPNCDLHCLGHLCRTPLKVPNHVYASICAKAASSGQYFFHNPSQTGKTTLSGTAFTQSRPFHRSGGLRRDIEGVDFSASMIESLRIRDLVCAHFYKSEPIRPPPSQPAPSQRFPDRSVTRLLAKRTDRPS